jgi:hypothetical protein
MKKASTSYLFALAFLNLLLAQGTAFTAAMWITAYNRTGLLFSSSMLLLLKLHWWPYLFVGFALILALISMRSRLSDGVFSLFIFGTFVIESFILFVSQIIFALPLTQVMTFR